MKISISKVVYIYPNANFSHVIKDVETECIDMKENDFLILIAGTNNISHSYQYDPYNDVQKIIECTKESLINVIYRYDVKSNIQF